MKRAKVSQLLISMLAVTLVISFVNSQLQATEEGHDHHEENALRKGETVTVTGINYCLKCSLRKEAGAKAQCSIHGHRRVLKVEKLVNAAGKEISDARKWVLHYLENETSKKLINSHDHEKIEVKGRLYPAERVLEVTSFRVVTTTGKEKGAGEVKEHSLTPEEIGKEVICPTTGKKFKVQSKTKAAEYKGKVYYFCCPGCAPRFKANPGKYIKEKD